MPRKPNSSRSDRTWQRLRTPRTPLTPPLPSRRELRRIAGGGGSARRGAAAAGRAPAARQVASRDAAEGVTPTDPSTAGDPDRPVDRGDPDRPRLRDPGRTERDPVDSRRSGSRPGLREDRPPPSRGDRAWASCWAVRPRVAHLLSPLIPHHRAGRRVPRHVGLAEAMSAPVLTCRGSRWCVQRPAWSSRPTLVAVRPCGSPSPREDRRRPALRSAGEAHRERRQGRLPEPLRTHIRGPHGQT